MNTDMGIMRRLLPALLCLVALVALVGPSVSTQTTIANNAADMSGHIVMVADSGTPRTVSNLFTFNRTSTNAPFAVGNAGAATVTNLSADQVDGLDSTRFIWARVVSTATGNQNDFAPGITSGQNTVVVMNNASIATVTGLAGGVDGQRVGFLSINAEVDFAHGTSAAGLNSAAANRFINFATSGATPILLGYTEFSYDGTNTRWRMTQHEQGNWITPTYAGANFGGLAAQTWTVDAGDISTLRYLLRSRTLAVEWNLGTTSVGGTPGASLTIGSGAFGGFSIVTTSGHMSVHSYTDNGGTEALGRCFSFTGNFIVLQKLGTANWTAAANTTTTLGSITFEVS